MPDKHAVLSASGSHRWLACTPSAQLETKFPPSTSVYAAEGTEAHSLAELEASYALGLIDYKAFEKRFAEAKEKRFFSQEMVEHCEAYAQYVSEKYAALKAEYPDAQAMLEARIEFNNWVPDGFGTADCLLLADGHMEVVDFKYGKGVRVEAYGNTQMRMYTLGAYQTYGLVYDVQNVTMTIFQPRLANGISSDAISLEELLNWGETYVKPRAKLAIDGKGDFAPSAETCKFCRAKAVCKARAEENLKMFDEAPDPFLLTDQEAGELLEKAADIRAWLSDLESYVSEKLFAGDEVPGWKLVAGRSVRKYADEAAVINALKVAGIDEALIYKPRELVTLTQLEKDFGKKKIGELLGDLIVKPEGKPTLAPESDKRPAINREKEIINLFEEE